MGLTERRRTKHLPSLYKSDKRSPTGVSPAIPSFQSVAQVSALIFKKVFIYPGNLCLIFAPFSLLRLSRQPGLQCDFNTFDNVVFDLFLGRLFIFSALPTLVSIVFDLTLKFCCRQAPFPAPQPSSFSDNVFFKVFNEFCILRVRLNLLNAD